MSVVLKVKSVVLLNGRRRALYGFLEMSLRKYCIKKIADDILQAKKRFSI
jgi:hypothetical protein